MTRRPLTTGGGFSAREIESMKGGQKEENVSKHPPPGALFAKQIAERLGVGVNTVHAYASRGQMPAPDGHDVHGHPWWLPGTLAWWRAEFIDDMTTTD